MAPMYGLAIDQQGSILSSTMETTVFKKFDRNGNFIILWEISAPPMRTSQSDRHCLRRQGDVYVVDTNNHRVQKFDGKLGGYLMKFGSRGNKASSMRRGASPSTGCVGTSTLLIAPISACRNST